MVSLYIIPSQRKLYVLTIRQHFNWVGVRSMVHKICKRCHTCQTAKVTNQKYVKLPPKNAETNPWDTLCIYLIGPYKIHYKGKTTLILWCLTIIDTVTGRFDMAPITNKTAVEVADIAERTWFSRYPLPQQITFDRGTEFMANFVKMVRNNYGF